MKLELDMSVDIPKNIIIDSFIHTEAINLFGKSSLKGKDRTFASCLKSARNTYSLIINGLVNLLGIGVSIAYLLTILNGKFNGVYYSLLLVFICMLWFILGIKFVYSIKSNLKIMMVNRSPFSKEIIEFEDTDFKCSFITKDDPEMKKVSTVNYNLMFLLSF